MQANLFLSLLKCHQSVGWQAGLSTCQAPTPVTNMSTHSLVFKNDSGSDIPHRIPAITYIIRMCLRRSASYRYIHSRLCANGKNGTNSILCLINICVQTHHSIRRRTEARQHTRGKMRKMRNSCCAQIVGCMRWVAGQIWGDAESH